MRLQQQISLERNRRWIGRELEVLIESTADDGRRTADGTPATRIGRSFRDGPEVDGLVYVRDTSVRPGDFLQARVTEARAYDLVAEASSLNT
jgi:ribosomal protein S12 methylthiotransferase